MIFIDQLMNKVGYSWMKWIVKWVFGLTIGDKCLRIFETRTL